MSIIRLRNKRLFYSGLVGVLQEENHFFSFYSIQFL